MRIIADAVKRFLIPGSGGFLFIVFGAGVVILNSGPFGMLLGRIWLTALLALYWLLSLPVVANALLTNLQRPYGTIRIAAEAQGAIVLVVIGNGSVHYASGAFFVNQLTRRSVHCTFEAARLYRLLDPERIVVSGGVVRPQSGAVPESELIRDQLVAFGVPADRMVLESASRNTQEQIANAADLIATHGLPSPVVVVTTAAHVPRVMRCCANRGLRAVPSVTLDLQYDDGRVGWRRWVPRAAALRGSESAMYEYLALTWAALQGR